MFVHASSGSRCTDSFGYWTVVLVMCGAQLHRRYLAFRADPGQRCPDCWLLRRFCCCAALPSSSLPMHVVVLMHHTELGRPRTTALYAVDHRSFAHVGRGSSDSLASPLSSALLHTDAVVAARAVSVMSRFHLCVRKHYDSCSARPRLRASNTAKLLLHFGAQLLCWGVKDRRPMQQSRTRAATTLLSRGQSRSIGPMHTRSSCSAEK